MPNVKTKDILKCKHPNSRKAQALSKKITKKTRNEKQKIERYVKENLIGEKIKWFKDNLDPEVNICTPEILQGLIEKYLTRFDEELEQIELKHSVGSRKNRQHASREDLINHTKKTELNEFNGCGIEVPDFLNTPNLAYIRKWSGELRFLQNIKLKRYSKKQLETLAKKSTITMEVKTEKQKETKETKLPSKEKEKLDKENSQDSTEENMDVD